jgi:hypothetical protein
VKHSAKAAARLAREREKREKRQKREKRDRPDRRDKRERAVSPARPAASRAVPAGGGPGHERDEAQSSRIALIAYGLVLAGIVAGLAVMRAGGQAVNGGTLVIAGALLAGSLTRLALPDGRAGLLGSRRRLVDVAAMAALGVGLLIAGFIVPS